MDKTAFVSGIAYIVFWVGYALGKIGTMPDPASEFTWTLPVSMLFLITPPFLLGLIAGLYHKDY